MDLGSIFLILSLLLLVGLYISRPFFDHKGFAITREEHDHSALQAERDRVLTALQELDFDYSMGKIPEEDYPAQRATMLQYGADVLRRLEVYRGRDESASSRSAQTRLEKVVTASVPTSVGTVGEVDDALEMQIAARRRSRQDKAAGFCPKCGGPLQKSDVFCPKCGARAGH